MDRDYLLEDCKRRGKLPTVHLPFALGVEALERLAQLDKIEGVQTRRGRAEEPRKAVT